MEKARRTPINIPHAGTVALRLAYRLSFAVDELHPVMVPLGELIELLAPYRGEDDPGSAETMIVQATALDFARRTVDVVERCQLGEDRLGQCVRNLFECLGEGQEGAVQGLRTGEDPESLMRP